MTAPTGLLYVNDIDVATLGVWVGRDIRGPWDAPTIKRPSAPVLGRLGRVGLTDSPAAESRRITALGQQESTDTASLQALEDRLKRLAYDGIVRVRVGDHADREWEATCLLRITPLGAWQTRTGQTVQFIFECEDPVAQAVTPTVIDFSAGATDCPLGSAVSQPVIRIGDDVTNPVVTMKDHRGQVVQTMGFTITIAAGDWLEIDCEGQTVLDQAGANQASTFDGATDFLELNPYHAGGTSGPWPTLSVSGGSLAVAEYPKRYL